MEMAKEKNERRKKIEKIGKTKSYIILKNIKDIHIHILRRCHPTDWVKPKMK